MAFFLTNNKFLSWDCVLSVCLLFVICVGYALKVTEGSLKSCRVPNTPDFPEINANITYDSDDYETFCWSDLSSQVEDYGTALFSERINGRINKSSIVIDGSDAYLVLDRAELCFGTYESNLDGSNWYPIDLKRGQLSMVDVEFIGVCEDLNDADYDIDVDFALSSYTIETDDNKTQQVLCDIRCLELVQSNPNEIVELQATCDVNLTLSGFADDLDSFDLQQDASELAVSVESWSAEKVIITIGNSDNIYPGGYLSDIQYSIVDKDGDEVCLCVSFSVFILFIYHVFICL